MNTQPSKVLIVGAGPSGMTAAIELTRMGVPVRLIERAAEPSTTSRALVVQARTLELFAQRGMLQPMLDKGNPARMVTVFAEGKQLFQMDFTHNGTDMPYMLMIPQSDTEQLMRDQLAKLNVPVEREVVLAALSITEHDAPVTAILRHKDGTLEETRPDYLIDCEGAHSIARTTLGLQFKGKTRSESYVLGDIHIDGGPAEDQLTIFSSEHGFLGMFPMQGGRFRLIASHPLHEPKAGDTAEPTLDEIQTIYNQRSHIPGTFHDMVWSSYFRINSRMIHQLRQGRVFLGGDSAHIHSPAGGQGMNTGIQDMINLSWKIALVIKSKASPKLLDTYTEDRVPVIQGVLEGTEGLTDIIGTQNTAGRFALEHFAPWLTSTSLVQTNATERMSQVLFDYRRSPLSKTATAAGKIHAGDRIPNLPVSQIMRDSATASTEAKGLQSLLETNILTLLCLNFTDAEALHQAASQHLAPWKGIVTVKDVATIAGHEDAFKNLFGAEPSLILVRPDGYAAFTGNAESWQQLTDYLNDWFPTA